MTKVCVEEYMGVTVIARSNFSLRQTSTPILPLASVSDYTTFWGPWEASCEATDVRKRYGEATTRLSSEGMTPPALVTPPRN